MNQGKGEKRKFAFNGSRMARRVLMVRTHTAITRSLFSMVKEDRSLHLNPAGRCSSSTPTLSATGGF